MLKDKFKALPNGVAIGDGLYHLLQSFSLLSSLEENYYHFEKIVLPEHQQTEFNNYPLYSLQKNNNNTSFSQSDWQLEQQQSSSINILLVDDEEDILYKFKESLASEGYHVEAFVDPMEALTFYAKSISIEISRYFLYLLWSQLNDLPHASHL
jgi:PleD family two-component response regulator